jgi:hypothetical protein
VLCTYPGGYYTIDQIILLYSAIDLDVVRIYVSLQLAEWHGLELTSRRSRN